MNIENQKILCEELGLKHGQLLKGLSVGGSLDLEGTGITELPEGLSVGGSLDLRGTGITELPEGLSVGGSLYLEPEKFSSQVAYRENCGRQSRTICAVFLQGEYKIKAGCFFDSFTKFCDAVNKNYSGKSAKLYISQAQQCVDELTKKLNGSNSND